jgi:hypothetical protein
MIPATDARAHTNQVRERQMTNRVEKILKGISQKISHASSEGMFNLTFHNNEIKSIFEPHLKWYGLQRKSKLNKDAFAIIDSLESLGYKVRVIKLDLYHSLNKQLYLEVSW